MEQPETVSPYEEMGVKKVGKPSGPDMPMNEPDEDLTLMGIFKRGWFLFSFQAGKQVLTALLGALPVSLIFAIVFSWPTLVGVEEQLNMTAYMIGVLGFVLVYLLYLPVLGGAVTCLTSAAHCAEPISILTAYRRTWSHYGHLLLAFLGVYIGTMAGLVLFIFPGVWFISRYGLAWMIVPLEKVSVSEAFKRSSELLQNRRGPFLTIQLCFLLLNALVSGILMVVVMTMSATTTVFAAQFVTMLISLQLVLMTIMPYIPSLVAFYYDCIRRHRIRGAQV